MSTLFDVGHEELVLRDRVQAEGICDSEDCRVRGDMYEVPLSVGSFSFLETET